MPILRSDQTKENKNRMTDLRPQHDNLPDRISK